MFKKTLTALLASLVLAAAGAAPAAPARASGIILFLGDAGGTSTLAAASIYGHNDPQALFLQHMPHIGLSETSALDRWVTDSAAGMTAIVTGQKTANGVLSEMPSEGGKDGRVLKTILEYAEEHGLSTGVISNMPMADATPAACYAHSDSRKKWGEIFAQVMHPRFGDGVDLVLGAGRTRIYNDTKAMGIDLDAGLKQAGFAVYDSPEAVPETARRAVALTDNAEYDIAAVTGRAIDILSRNPKGFFLMVEVDMHTDNVKRGLEHALLMDKIVRQTAGRVKDDTLILFTADHSFDLRIRGGKKGEPILPPDYTRGNPAGSLRVDGSHTGEQVLVAAQGPGADQVHGYMLNTDLFHVMMRAYGFE
ncbi:MAG: alkaline phosphatase [Acidobacteria bacterium]|nr:alkaline phosphatase [Acidobacteriota bacterium]